MKLFVMHSLPVRYYFMAFKCKYRSHDPIPEHPQPMFLPQCETPSFTTIYNKRQIYVSAYFDLHIS